MNAASPNTRPVFSCRVTFYRVCRWSPAAVRVSRPEAEKWSSIIGVSAGTAAACSITIAERRSFFSLADIPPFGCRPRVTCPVAAAFAGCVYGRRKKKKKIITILRKKKNILSKRRTRHDAGEIVVVATRPCTDRRRLATAPTCAYTLWVGFQCYLGALPAGCLRVRVRRSYK